VSAMGLVDDEAHQGNEGSFYAADDAPGVVGGAVRQGKARGSGAPLPFKLTAWQVQRMLALPPLDLPR
jgi:hypothetical protein